MTSITHWDGEDVVVIDAQGMQVPAVSEVRFELGGLATVAVAAGALAWIQTLLAQAPAQLLACTIHADGRVQHCGPVRVVLG